MPEKPDWVASLNRVTLNNPQSWRAACFGINVSETDPMIAGSIGSFDSINAAVKKYFEGHDRQVVDKAIRRRLAASAHLLEKDVKALLCWLIDQLDTKNPPTEPPDPSSVSIMIGAPVIAQIKKMRLFACTDSPAFRDKIVPELLAQVQNRMWRAGEDPTRIDKANAWGNAVPYKFVTLKMARAAVMAARSAVCTTFAMSVGELLCEGVRPALRGYRVEIVAAPDHCYVLVNRTGGTTHGILPPSSQWGVGTVLIDAWAGSLGHPIFYDNIEDYPSILRCYLDCTVRQSFDSNQPESTGPSLGGFGGIKLKPKSEQTKLAEAPKVSSTSSKVWKGKKWGDPLATGENN